MIRYSLRHGAKPEQTRSVTPGKTSVKFVNHQGFTETKPVMRVIKANEVRGERSKSSYLNPTRTEHVVRSGLPNQVKGVRIMRGTMPTQGLSHNSKIDNFG